MARLLATSKRACKHLHLSAKQINCLPPVGTEQRLVQLSRFG